MIHHMIKWMPLNRYAKLTHPSIIRLAKGFKQIWVLVKRGILIVADQIYVHLTRANKSQE